VAPRRLMRPCWRGYRSTRKGAVWLRLPRGRQRGSGAGCPDGDRRGLTGGDCERGLRGRRSRHWTRPCLGTGRALASCSALLRFVLFDSRVGFVACFRNPCASSTLSAAVDGAVEIAQTENCWKPRALVSRLSHRLSEQQPADRCPIAPNGATPWPPARRSAESGDQSAEAGHNAQRRPVHLLGLIREPRASWIFGRRR
jgi:hypothetical protein